MLDIIPSTPLILPVIIVAMFYLGERNEKHILERFEKEEERKRGRLLG